MSQDALIAGKPTAVGEGLDGVAADWSADKQVFPVPWGKAMMWIFLLSDTFIFTCFLTSYMNVRLSTTAPWTNPMGAAQFGSSFFMITGFHGLHVSAGVIYLSVVARRVWNGFYDRKGSYETVEVTGLYWHFVDLVWVFIFAFFYLW